MHYSVTARFKPQTAADFYEKLTDIYEKLTDSTIASLKPDGKEIVASVKRAKISRDGTVRWSEVCYCPTPLQHEREPIYDHYFGEVCKCEESQASHQIARSKSSSTGRLKR